MRFIASILLSVSIAATLAHAQSQMPPHFNHVVIVVQENRTPDNLFGSAPIHTGNCSGQDDFEPGVDIQDWGYNNGNTKTCFASHPLGWIRATQTTATAALRTRGTEESSTPAV